MGLTAQDLFPMAPDMLTEKIKKFFDEQKTDTGEIIPAPKCYVIYLEPVIDLATGVQKEIEHKNFLGKVTGIEKCTEIVFEPFEQNIVHLNTELYQHLVKANESIILQNQMITEQNNIIAEFKTSLATANKNYTDLLNSLD